MINASVVSVGEILQQNLSIPSYQRPYRWQTRHVNELFDDLLLNRNNHDYRLGTIILHKESSHDVVDGQQRLITLTILCKVLIPDSNQKLTLLEHRFTSSGSVSALQRNSNLIRQRVKQLAEADRKLLFEFLIGRCQVVRIILDDIGEAFQFFDSQNARGKGLFPHDLLKAYHLRHMDAGAKNWRDACINRWEKEARKESDRKSPDGLQVILGDIIYPIRKWCRGEWAGEFNNSQIHVFKGVDLSKDCFPFIRTLNIRNQTDDYPFQINQTIINGRRFFEYVDHYLDSYRKLFVEECAPLEEIRAVINGYDGSNRVGDRYVRNLFVCAILLYHDKFGEEKLAQAAKICFAWCYRSRLTLMRVVRESIDNLGQDHDGLIRALRDALRPDEILSFVIPPLSKTEIRAKSGKIQKLLEAFEKLGYLHD